MSTKIIDKITKAGGTYFANDNISQYLSKNDIDSIQEALEVKFREILDILVIDSENDHNTNETPQRIAKMYIREVFKGR